MAQVASIFTKVSRVEANSYPPRSLHGYPSDLGFLQFLSLWVHANRMFRAGKLKDRNRGVWCFENMGMEW